MRIQLDVTKSIEENAARYFETGKKAKSKIEGAREMRDKAAKKHAKVAEAQDAIKQAAQKPAYKTHWYHKYRWGKTRNGNLVVAGQDASANEALVKKHGEEAQLIFHSELPGSPFALLFAREVADGDIEDVAQLVAVYSRAWREGLAQVTVLYVRPDQVSKTAESGEYLGRGSFVIRGTRNTTDAPVTLHVGRLDHEKTQSEVFVGSQEAVKAHCEAFAEVIPGSEKTSAVAKKLASKLGLLLDDLVRALPAGGTTIK